MVTTVTVGSKNVLMASNGATPVRYKMTFKADLMVELNQMNKGTRDEGELIDLISRLAFIMSRQAENDKAALAAMTFEDYINWLSGFEAMDIANAAEQILGVYMDQTNGDSTPKKDHGQVNEN